MKRLEGYPPQGDIVEAARRHRDHVLLVNRATVAQWDLLTLQRIDDAGVQVTLVPEQWSLAWQPVQAFYTPEPLLEIMICTVPSRSKQLRRLIAWLRSQSPHAPALVQMQVDDQPSKTLGEKRHRMLVASRADYVAFIDDDDRVAPDYVRRILTALLVSERPDCVGFRGVMTTDGARPEMFEHSMRHRQWETRNGVHLRCPNHLNPVRRELALAVGYPTMDHGEDRVYSERLLPLLKSEAFLDDQPMYYYWFRNKARLGA